VAFHTGDEGDADDWADVSALCERFDIPIPPGYRRFRWRVARGCRRIDETGIVAALTTPRPRPPSLGVAGPTATQGGGSG
jgi:hypothetical protein